MADGKKETELLAENNAGGLDEFARDIQRCVAIGKTMPAEERHKLRLQMDLDYEAICALCAALELARSHGGRVQ